MERYLLDTNILVFMVSGELDNISKDVKHILYDLNNQLFTSSVAVSELLQLYRLNKIQQKEKFKNASELVAVLGTDFFITILPFSKEHISTLAKLNIAIGHNDPFDHSIISHAITEKLTLVSSDKKFENYTKQKLKFAFNKR